jgi:hypothetical protein
VNSDGSKGVHQPQYSSAGLTVASMWARSYAASIVASEQVRTDGGEGAKITGTLKGNDGAALVGATVVLQASSDGGSSWSAAANKRMTGSAFTFLTGPVMGETKFRVVYTPDAGVTYATDEMTVKVPFTSIGLVPAAASSGWVDSAVRVSLSAPATGAITFYSLSGATAQAATVYTGPFVLTANGQTDVTYWSTSAEGGEVAHVQPVLIDRAVPTVSADASTLYVDDATVHLTAHDTFSGPKYLEYSLDGGGWTKVDGSSATVAVGALGAHSLRARATNNLGHTGTVAVWAFSVKRSTWLAPNPSAGSVTIKRGATWLYAATLRSHCGATVAGKTVLLQRSTNGSSWSTVASRTSSGGGTVSRSAKMSTKGTTYWRWYVPADGSYFAAAGSRIKLVVK